MSDWSWKPSLCSIGMPKTFRIRWIPLKGYHLNENMQAFWTNTARGFLSSCLKSSILYFFLCWPHRPRDWLLQVMVPSGHSVAIVHLYRSQALESAIDLRSTNKNHACKNKLMASCSCPSKLQCPHGFTACVSLALALRCSHGFTNMVFTLLTFFLKSSHGAFYVFWFLKLLQGVSLHSHVILVESAELFCH